MRLELKRSILRRDMSNETLVFVIMSCIVYLLIFLYFYPPYFIVSDEQHYLRTANLILKGKLWVDDEFYAYSFLKYKDRYVSRYPPGMSILLLPFVVFGYRAAFLLNLLLFFLSFLVFYRILKEMKMNRLLSFLFLLYPGFIYFSRNLLPEIPSLFFVLLTFYFYLKRKYFLSSIPASFSLLIRYTNVVCILPFLFFPILRNKKNIRILLPCLLYTSPSPRD